MAINSKFRRNGAVLTWQSSKARVDGENFFGFTGIDYEEKLERAIAYGMNEGGPPRGFGGGKYGVSGGNLKGHKDEMLAFAAHLTEKAAGMGAGSVPFFFSLQHVEGDLEIEERLWDCQLDGFKHSHSEGTDALIVESPITIHRVSLKLVRDGVTKFIKLYPDPENRYDP
jgi:hypothetical protein